MIDTKTTDFVYVLKLKVYKRALLIGLLVILVLWIQIAIYGTSVISEFYVFPLYAFYCLTSLLMFNNYGTRYISIFESLSFASVFLYYSLFIYSEIYASLSQPAISLQKFLLWIPIIYTLAFLTYRPQVALRLSVLFIVSILIPGATYAFLKWGAIGFQNNMILLLQIYASGIIYITLFYAVAILKERFTETDRTAKIMMSRANTDSLTMAYSNTKIRELLDFYAAASSVSDLPLSIAFIDANHLKQINDTFGHASGDYVLRRIVEVLGSSLRDSDVLGRIGGDEFLLILPDTNAMQAKMIVKRLQQTISDTNFENVEKVTVSIGIASRQHGDSKESLLARADVEMYNQKSSLHEDHERQLH